MYHNYAVKNKTATVVRYNSDKLNALELGKILISYLSIEIFYWFQSKALWLIVYAPWFVSKTTVDLKASTTVKEEIQRVSSLYTSKLEYRPNYLAVNCRITVKTKET